MPNWDLLITQRMLAEVLPGEYARYLRPICGALVVFLERLPAAQQTSILAQQAALGPAATASERLAMLARGCPTLHKLGQILARDHRLSAEFRGHLQQLESLPPTTGLAAIEGILAKEFGPLDRLGVSLAPPAVAEASVAVVIPFRRDAAATSAPAEGVFKILKPGIEERLGRELESLEHVGAYLDQRCDEFAIPHLDYQEVFQQTRDLLRHEIRLDLEQRHLAQAAVVYRGEPRVHIPALLEHCTPRVTAMERVIGHKITEHRLTGWAERRWLASLVVGSLVARPIFSSSGQALFHGDPHAGNLMLTDQGRLAILDWSLVGSLAEAERAAMAQVLLGAMMLHAGHVVTAVSGLAERLRLDLPALRSVVHAWLARVRRGQFPGFTWLVGLLDDAVQRARLRLGANLMLFRKSLHTLEGVVGDLGAGENRIDDVLLGEFARHLAGEWPRRWLALPHCRQFATRLSNADLTQWMLNLPGAAMRFWIEPD